MHTENSLAEEIAHALDPFPMLVPANEKAQTDLAEVGGHLPYHERVLAQRLAQGRFLRVRRFAPHQLYADVCLAGLTKPKVSML